MEAVGGEQMEFRRVHSPGRQGTLAEAVVRYCPQVVSKAMAF